MIEAEKWLDFYQLTNVNSSLKLQRLSRIALIDLAEQARKLSGDRNVQFERLLMEAPIIKS